MSDNLYDEAMQANLVGDTSRATNLLKQLVDEEPENLEAWIALSRQADFNDRHYALTRIVELDPDNEYAKRALETEKPKAPVQEAELVPGIPMKQARTIGLGLVLYTLLICGATFLITSAISGNKAASAQQLAQAYQNQTQVQETSNAAGTQVAVAATQQSVDATATQLMISTPLPTATATRAFELPTVVPPTPTPTTVSFRVEQAPPSLSGRILAWGGKDVRSKDYLQLRVYSGASGTFELLNRELGRNPLMSADNTTVFEQWRADAPRLYVSILEPMTPGGTLDAMLGNQLFITGLRDPSMSADAKRIAFIAADYTTKVEGAYIVDLTDPSRPKFHKLNQDAASYTAITLSPDGLQAVAVRVDGGSTDMVVFDLATLFSAPAPVEQPVVGEGTPTVPAPPAAVLNFPLRPLTTDGNTLIEGSPSFSADGTRVVYEAVGPTTPNNRDLYIVTVGTAPGAPLPIMTTEGNDAFPVFSPDGNMVAFASDRQTGVYNLYIYDTTTRLTYQLTEEDSAVYPGQWIN